MSENATADPPSWAPWRELLNWAPFKIDALGLVTLLGAEQVNASVGRLVKSWIEFFPLLGAFVIAGDAFRNKEAGFNLYNITQGIHTTDMASWLTRWMRSQEFEANRSLVRWTVEARNPSPFETIISIALPVGANGMLLIMTILSYDWYGFANAVAMSLSIVVRWYMVSSIRNAIDNRVNSAYAKAGADPDNTPAAALRRWEEDARKKKASINGGDTEAKESPRPHYLEHGWNGMEPAKVLIIMNDAKAVTMMIPRDLLAPPSVFIANLEPPNRAFYGIARWVGWLAFAVQVVTIGMADLATQIITVALLVIPTVLFVAKLGCDDSRWGMHIMNFIRKCMPNGLRRHAPAVYDYGPLWPELQSVCWIGSMLKAEVYEWPWSHEFAMDDKGYVMDDTEYDRKLGRPISKRQHLYAWLQLSTEEKVSMDKWDLFPHGRGNNKKWVDVLNQMTSRIIKLQKHAWGIKSLVGTLPVPQLQPTIPAPPTQDHDNQSSHLPPIDTKLPKAYTTRPLQEPETQDTADTAQDGTVLDPNSPSINTAASAMASFRAGHRLSGVLFSSVADEQDNIKPIKRASTEPPVRRRRHSVAVLSASGSAFWVTNRLTQQQEQEDVQEQTDGGNASDEFEETVSETSPITGGESQAGAGVDSKNV